METIQQVMSILFVLALLGAALWWLRRKGAAQISWGRHRNKPLRSLQLIERLSLTPQHSLHLVRMADRAMVIGVSPTGCSLLDSSDWKDLGVAMSQSALVEKTGAAR